jgi:hypothetical protein
VRRAYYTLVALFTAVSVVLVALQWGYFHAWCTLCLTSALLSYEPNLAVFGSGKQEDYFELYRSTVTAIKQVDASLRVGGPVTANSEWSTSSNLRDHLHDEPFAAAFSVNIL